MIKNEIICHVLHIIGLINGCSQHKLLFSRKGLDVPYFTKLFYFLYV